MATKRQIPDDSKPRPSWKRHKPNNSNSHPTHGKNSFKKAHPVNDLKSTIRSIRRLLDRNDDLPAGVRIEKERELRTAQHELSKQQRAKQRSEIIGKWHKIRFFERQKAERRLKKARRELEEVQKGEDVEEKSVETARKKVEDCEIEVAYALYFPLETDYVPLFRKKREDGGGGSVEDSGMERYGDEKMWAQVKSCLLNGKLQDLREGRLDEDEAHGQKELPTEAIINKKRKMTSEAAQSANSRGRVKKPEVQEEEEEREEEEEEEEEQSGDQSGGSFFE